MRGRRGETAVLVVSVKLPNYLIVPCGYSACKRKASSEAWKRVPEWAYRLLSVLFQDHDNSPGLLGKSLLI